MVVTIKVGKKDRKGPFYFVKMFLFLDAGAFLYIIRIKSLIRVAIDFF